MTRSAASSDTDTENKMKKENTKRFYCLSLVALLCALTLLLGSCSERFVSEGPDYRDRETKVTYEYAPFCYEAIETSKDVYAESENDIFYEIVGQDPLKWLCESSGTVFYAKGISLPSLDKMNISYIDICAEGSSVAVRSKITDSEHISAIVSSYISADSLEYSGDVASVSYKIRFADTSLGLYYSVSFLGYADGSAYIYNRSEERMVKAPAELINYINELA